MHVLIDIYYSRVDLISFALFFNIFAFFIHFVLILISNFHNLIIIWYNLMIMVVIL